MTSFRGTKIVLLIEGQILAIRRDDSPGINWPGLWDLPGGGREGAESAATCVLRELQEETGLILPEAALSPPVSFDTGIWFGAHMSAKAGAARALGDEGQELALFSPADFYALPDVIPHFPGCVRRVLELLS